MLDLLKLPLTIIQALFSILTALGFLLASILPALLSMLSGMMSFLNAILPFLARVITALLSFTASIISISFSAGKNMGSLTIRALHFFTTPYPYIILIAFLGACLMAPVATRTIIETSKWLYDFYQHLHLKFRVARGFRLTPGREYFESLERLRVAAAKGEAYKVSVLLAAGIQVNDISVSAENPNQRNALICAAMYRRKNTIKVLLEAGANLNSIQSSYDVACAISFIYKELDPELAFKFLDKMSPKKIQALAGYSEFTVVLAYNKKKLKESLFESIFTGLRMARKTYPEIADVEIFNNEILSMLKPEWLTNQAYQELCEDVTKNTLIAMNKVDSKKNKAVGTRLQSIDIQIQTEEEMPEADVPVIPVIFRSSEEPEQSTNNKPMGLPVIEVANDPVIASAAKQSR